MSARWFVRTLATLALASAPAHAGAAPARFAGPPDSYTFGSGRGVVADGAGGWYLAYQDQGQDSTGTLVWHLAGDLTPLPLWPTGGLRLPALTTDIASDGRGGVLVCGIARDGSSLALWRLGADGLPAWSQPARLVAGEGPTLDAPIAADGAGGAWVVMRGNSIRTAHAHLWRVDPSGVPAAAWPDTGVRPGGLLDPASHLSLVADGGRAAFVAWADAGPGDSVSLTVTRVRADGSTDPAWPAAGVVVRRVPVVTRAVGDQLGQRLLADGAGGVFVAWQERGTAPDSTAVRIARLSPDGAPAPGWPDGGREVTGTSWRRTLANLAGDDAGGVFVAWNDAAVARVQHLRSDGTPAAGVWAASGIAPGDARTSITSQPPVLAADGAGGAYVLWDQDQIPNQPLDSLRIQRFQADGTRGDGWPDAGRALLARSRISWPEIITPGPMLLDSGPGGPVAAWEDNAALLVPVSILVASVPLPAPPAPVATGTLAFARAHPDPAAGPVLVTLTLAAPARVALRVLDAAGRSVRDLGAADRGAGAFEFGWDGRDGAGRRVRPGLYFLEAVGGGAHAAARVVVTR